MDIFGLIDTECDHTIYSEELEILWEAMNSLGLNENQINWIDEQKKLTQSVEKETLMHLLNDA
jgi:hypothetical protein